MNTLMLSIMVFATLMLASCGGAKKVETLKPNNAKYDSEESKLCFTQATTVVLNSNHFFIITKGQGPDLGDDKMSANASKDDARTTLSFFNGDFLKKFSDFILKNKKKNISKKMDEISKNEVKKDNLENIEFIEKLTKSKIYEKDINFFDIKVINSNFISCMKYDIESSIFNKLKDTKYKMSKEEIHNNLVEFLKKSEYKSIKIK